MASVLFTVWRYPRFSESRWLTVGTSCRVMVAAFLTGITDMVRHIKKDKSNSQLFLKGFSRLDATRLEFLTICAVVSRVPEAIQAELMHDNRVAMVADSLWDAAAKDVKWVIDVPEGTWT